MVFVTSQRRKRLRQRGAVLVEYTLILAFVAAPAVAGLIGGAVYLSNNYSAQRARYLEPFP